MTRSARPRSPSSITTTSTRSSWPAARRRSRQRDTATFAAWQPRFWSQDHATLWRRCGTSTMKRWPRSPRTSIGFFCRAARHRWRYETRNWRRSGRDASSARGPPCGPHSNCTATATESVDERRVIVLAVVWIELVVAVVYKNTAFGVEERVDTVCHDLRAHVANLVSRTVRRLSFYLEDWTPLVM